METVNLDKRKLKNIIIIYGIIVAFVNYIGFLLANSGDMPAAQTEEYSTWLDYMSKHSTMITVLSVLSFVIPILLIIRYRYIIVNKYNERIINLPFTFAAIGSLGWGLSFVTEAICLVYVMIKFKINITEILFVSFINILQTSICIFTLAFLILNFIHRKLVLPRLFPNGNLSKYNIGVNPSVRFIVIVFYLSICIFPVFFVTLSLVNVIRNNHLNVGFNVFILLGIIMLFSVIILWAFCDFFTAPLIKLKQGIQNIKSGDYNHRVDIVSSDDFGDLADAFNEMTGSLDEKNKKIHAIQDSIIKGMAVMVGSRDDNTGGHISRTSDCVKIFVEKLVSTDEGTKYTTDFCKAVIKAAPMHDLGKIHVDDAILRKPGKFTDEEYEIMKTHSSEGARIVESVLSQVDDEKFKTIAINVAHYHHEKWNGMGYPEQISGEDIPLEARIMALADVFDALVSKRHYKDSFTYDKAFQIIEESLGSHFDPELGKVFIECRPELEALYNGYSEQEA